MNLISIQIKNFNATLKKMEKAESPGLMILEPVRIENFSFFNSKIRLLIDKYKNSTKNMKFIDEVFKEGEIDDSRCMLRKKEEEENILDADTIIQSHFEKIVLQKTRKLILKWKTEDEKKKQNYLSQSESKEQSRIQINQKIQKSDITYIENNFDATKLSIQFTNPFLSLAFSFFILERSKKDVFYTRKSIFQNEIEYLESHYHNYIMNHQNNTQNNVKGYADYICSTEQYFLESYHNRYLFAEIFLYLRIGKISDALQLIEKYKDFFNSSAPEIEKSIVDFYQGKYVSKMYYEKMRGAKNDRFKLLIFQILCNVPDVFDILSTFEDFLWFTMLHAKNIDDLYSRKDNLDIDGCKFLLSLFCRKYKDAFSILLTKDFPIIEMFFTAREMSNHTKIIEPYVEIVFLFIKKFTKKERKIELVNSLCTGTKSEKIIADILVKTDSLDLIGLKDDICGLNTKIVDQVAYYLQKNGDREKLLQLYYLFNNDRKILQILNEYLIDLILKDKKEINKHNDIIDYFSKTTNSKEKDKMLFLINIIHFTKSQNMADLKNSNFFSSSHMSIISELRPVISKLIPLITKLINLENDINIANNFINLCNSMGLGDKCRSLMGENLILIL